MPENLSEPLTLENFWVELEGCSARVEGASEAYSPGFT